MTYPHNTRTGLPFGWLLKPEWRYRLKPEIRAAIAKAAGRQTSK